MTISIFAFEILIWVALGLCVFCPVTLIALFIKDWKRGKLW